MKIIELNRPAVSPQLSIKELSIKPCISHTMYMGKSRVIQTATLESPVYRLCKDYEIEGHRFGLNLLTDKNDMKKAEKFMDKIAKKLSKDEVISMTRSNNPFVYLNEEFGAK